MFFVWENLLQLLLKNPLTYGKVGVRSRFDVMVSGNKHASFKSFGKEFHHPYLRIQFLVAYAHTSIHWITLVN